MSFDDKTKFENPASVSEILQSIRQLIKSDLSVDNKILELTDVADVGKEFEKNDSSTINTIHQTHDKLNNNLFNSKIPGLNDKNLTIDDKSKSEPIINKFHNKINAEIYVNDKSGEDQDSLTESVSTIQNLIDQVNYLQKQLNDKEAMISKSKNIDNTATTTIDQLVKSYIKDWLGTNLPKITSDLVEKEIRQLFSNSILRK